MLPRSTEGESMELKSGIAGFPDVWDFEKKYAQT